MSSPRPTDATTRRVIVSNIVSLDGYVAGPPGGPPLPIADAFDAYNAERLRAADTLLVGRTSYDMFRGYWPPVQDDTDAGPAQHEISRLNNAIEKVVVSDTLTSDETTPWSSTTRIVARSAAHETIAELKRGPGRDILVLGSRTLWNDLLAHDLVDELHLLIGPVVLGGGTPTFAAPPRGSMRLLATRTWEGSASVLATYEILT
ncbi:MAG: deaminase [Pseudonocardiaceae bacterium]|nr:deaminase [Pseudonocardiaceae bacterium]